LSDEAKREKEFEAKVAARQKQIREGKKLSAQEIEKVLTSRLSKVRRLQLKAAEMREKAKEVERSGTGNVKAAATYRRAATEYLKQVETLQKKK